MVLAEPWKLSCVHDGHGSGSMRRLLPKHLPLGPVLFLLVASLSSSCALSIKPPRQASGLGHRALPTFPLRSVGLIASHVFSLQSPASILPADFTLSVLFLNPSLSLPAPACSPPRWPSLFPGPLTKLLPPAGPPAQFPRHSCHFLERFL